MSSRAEALNAAAAPTVQSARALLQAVPPLLQFDLPESLSPSAQREQCTQRIRQLSTTRLQLERKLQILEHRAETWHDTVSKEVAGDPAEPPPLLQAYKQMTEDPEGLAQTIEQVSDAVTQLTFMEEDVKLILAGLHTPSTADTTPTGTTTPPPTTSSQANVPPPRLQLPQFSGDKEAWFNFWPLFEQAIDQKPFSDVEKLAYLRSCLTGPALDEIAGYTLVPENYSAIKDLLQRRFGDVRVLREKLFAQLDALRWDGQTAGAFRSFLHSVECILRQLRNLGESTNQPLIRHLIEKKLPVDIKLIIEDRKLSSDTWTTDTLLSALQHLLVVRENSFAAVTATLPANRSTPKPPTSLRTSACAAISKTDKNSHLPNRAKPSKSAATNSAVPSTPCVFCSGMHWNKDCPKYRTPRERHQRAQQAHLCFRCLSSDHASAKCSARNCRICNRPHHPLLCFRQQKKQEQPLQPKSPPPTAQPLQKTSNTAVSANTSVAHTACNTAVSGRQHTGEPTPLLLCQQINLFNPSSPAHTVPSMVFLDSGSQVTFISESLAAKLRLPSSPRGPLQVAGVGASGAQYPTSAVTFGIKLQDGSTHAVQAFTLPTITGRFLHASISEQEADLLRNSVSDVLTTPLKWSVPDVLIGSDFLYTINPRAERRLPSGFFLIDSAIGPMIGGSGKLAGIPKGDRLQASTVIVCPAKVDLDAFWELELFGITPAKEAVEDDQLALQQFEGTICRLSDGRYQVGWPWKKKEPALANNYGLCVGRLKSVLNRLQQSPSLLQQYEDTFKQQLTDGIIEKAPDVPDGPLVSYLPHHGVVNEQKHSTKLRVVYDASASCPQGHALNDYLLRGPIFLPKLVGVLLRMRQASVVLVADIEKAYHQISLRAADRDATRFLWVEQPGKPLSATNRIISFRFARIPFGVVSSPFLLAATIQHHLQNSTSPWAERILADIYVDNVMLSAQSDSEAIEAYKEAKRLFSSALMNLRQFLSNSPEVTKAIEEVDRYPNSSMKVLGIEWNTDDDTLRLGTLPMPQVEPSQREILRFIARHFDPLGLYCPALLPLKTLLQDLTKAERNLIAQSAESIKNEWRSLRQNWKAATFVIQRHLPQGNVQLHAFTDASERAFATAVFVRCGQGGNAKTTLVYAKSRLAPLRGLTIPRMELMGILLGATSLSLVAEQMNLPNAPKLLWTDSRCALAWVLSSPEHKLPRFVKNRVEQIRGHSGIEFRFVAGVDNPADLATRGCLPEQLADVSNWWSGPPWLAEAPEQWPKSQPISDEILHDEIEPTTTPVLTAVTTGNSPYEPFIEVARFSQWGKLVRVTARSLQFLGKLSRGKFASLPPPAADHSLSSRDYTFAETLLIRQAQNSVSRFDVEKWSLVRDHKGVWRCHGRLTETELPSCEKYPIFLPRSDPITSLIIHHYHCSMLHGGVTVTLTKLRRRYWIPRGRRAVASIISRCVGCRRWSSKPFALPPMPPLPESRVRQSGAFRNVGVDLFGPIFIVAADGTRVKRWITLFTCFLSRAVHLEVTEDLSATSFLHCLRRFVARRGQPTLMLSDNATNFKLTAATLKLAREFLAPHMTDWQFITELSPWKGGVYERMVGITKDAMRKAIGNRLLNDVDLRTLTAEVEAVVNQRPLTFVAADSLEVIRPVDFLQPEAHLQMDPGEDPSDTDYNPTAISSRQRLLDQWRRSTVVLHRFWNFWQHSYLHFLRERAQSTHRGPRCQTKRNPKVGEVVLLIDENQPRGAWKLARIVDLLDGSGGFIRTAMIETANGHRLKRPISLLCPLEVTDEDAGEAEQNSLRLEQQELQQGTRDGQQTSGASSTHHMVTRSKTRQPLVGVSAACMLLCLMAFSSRAEGSPLSVQLCPYRHSGVFMKIPPRRNCSFELGEDVNIQNVSIYVPTLVRINATYCSRTDRVVCTYAFLRWSLKVVSDVTNVSSIPASDCVAISTTKMIGSLSLQPSGPNRWKTSNPTRYAYPILWGTECTTTTNYVLEFGEITFVNGSGALSDFTRTSGCQPSANKCYTARETIVWNFTDFTSKCRMRLQGVYSAHVSSRVVVVDQLQTAFVRSSNPSPSLVANCNITSPIFMENDIVVSREVQGQEENRTEGKARVFLAEKTDKESDPENARLQFLYEKGVEREAVRWCAARNQFLEIVRWVSISDTSAAARMLLGRSDIAAHYVGESMLITACQSVVPSKIYHDHRVGEKCFEWLPVEMGGRVVFVHPHTRDVVLHSREIACAWRPPEAAVKVKFEDLDLMTETSHPLVFNKERLPDMSITLIQMALDRLGRTALVSAPQSNSPNLLREWMTDSEEFLAEIGHDVDIGAHLIQEGYDEISSRWKTITGGSVLMIIAACAIVVYFKCGSCVRRTAKTTVNIRMTDLLDKEKGDVESVELKEGHMTPTPQGTPVGDVGQKLAEEGQGDLRPGNQQVTGLSGIYSPPKMPVTPKRH